MNHEHEELDPGTLALRSLAGSEPSMAVRQRIVAGAVDRKNKRPLMARAFIGLALAGAATAAVVVALRVDTVPAPIDGRAVAPVVASVDAPAPGSVRSEGTFAVGPHRVIVAPGGSVLFESTGSDTRLRVEKGSARFEVEHLQAGESFQVRTGQVLAEVVGTRFAVAADGACSSVSVAEGRVKVTEENGGIRSLGVGEEGRFCRSDAPARAAADEGEGLVREALVLVSRGQDLEKAASLLARYRQDFPGGAFQEEALFHLTLVKAKLGANGEAAALAREFARAFPQSERTEKLQRALARTAP